MNQQKIEDTYSRRAIRQHVLADVDQESPVFIKCMESVNQYLKGSYYASKQKRVEEICQGTVSVQDIVLEIFIAVLPIQEISPIQSVSTQIGNRIGIRRLLDGVKTSSELLAVCEKSGLFTIYHSADEVNKTGTLGIMAHYHLDKEVQDFIQKTMYLPPMISEPVEWTDNSTGGHLNGSGSVILGSLNHHQGEQSLDAINLVQSIPWELNERMLSIEETPNKPENMDTAQKREQFTMMKRQSRVVYENMVELGNKFYLVWKNDKRGRMNSQGYHIDLQSTSYKKSIIQFANKEILS